MQNIYLDIYVKFLFNYNLIDCCFCRFFLTLQKAAIKITCSLLLHTRQ